MQGRLAALILVTQALCYAAPGASTPVITEVSPTSGLEIGGTKIVVTGSGFDAGIKCLLPCPPTFSVGGGGPILPLEFSDTRGVFVAPPHEPGVVSLTLRRSDGETATIEEAFTYVDFPWQRILLPIATGPTGGANASRWVTEIGLHNAGNDPISIGPVECVGDACPAIYPLMAVIPPHQTLLDPPIGLEKPSREPGRFLYVSKSGADALFASLRTRNDVRGTAAVYGASIPIVRDSDLVSGPIDLVDVPLCSCHRTNLRIYDTVGVENAKVIVHVHDVNCTSGKPLASFLLTLSYNGDREFQEKPSYAQLLDLYLASPELIGVHRTRIEIEPVTPGLRIWAFATVTSEETGVVTTITPR